MDCEQRRINETRIDRGPKNKQVWPHSSSPSLDPTSGLLSSHHDMMDLPMRGGSMLSLCSQIPKGTPNIRGGSARDWGLSNSPEGRQTALSPENSRCDTPSRTLKPPTERRSSSSRLVRPAVFLSRQRDPLAFPVSRTWLVCQSPPSCWWRMTDIPRGRSATHPDFVVKLLQKAFQPGNQPGTLPSVLRQNL